jgi:prepilin-type N-terminal cleavage/methylation domain-containing protein
MHRRDDISPNRKPRNADSRRHWLAERRRLPARRAWVGRVAVPWGLGFTLIEVLAVLVILSVIAAAAVYTVRFPIQTARMDLAVQQLTLLDNQIRQHAQRFGHVAQLTIDLDQATLYWTETAGDRLMAHSHRLEGARLDRFASATRRADRGRVMIAYRTNGETPSYAVRLRSGRGPSKWLLFVGLTGQTVQVDDEREISDTFRFLSARADVD